MDVIKAPVVDHSRSVKEQRLAVIDHRGQIGSLDDKGLTMKGDESCTGQDIKGDGNIAFKRGCHNRWSHLERIMTGKNRSWQGRTIPWVDGNICSSKESCGCGMCGLSCRCGMSCRCCISY